MTANDIERLDDYQFRRFMRNLLRNEVIACGPGAAQFVDNPGDGNDEGQDAETTRLVAGQLSDNLIPAGVTVWQYKAEQRAPTEAQMSKEIDKERPKSVLNQGGNYRLISQRPRVNETARDMILRDLARKKGYLASQVAFFAQATLADRARLYPSLALLPFFQRPLDHVHSFDWWAAQHNPIQFDEVSRQRQLAQITEFLRVSSRPTHIRVVGPAGVGKTRLVLEAIKAVGLESCTAYAPKPNAQGFEAFYKWCSQQRARLVLVVDECDEPLAMQLRTTAVSHDLPVALITIDKVEDIEITSTDRDLRVSLDPMTEVDIVRILDGSTTIDKQRAFSIAHITGGFVKLAHVVAEACARDQDLGLNPSALVSVDIIRAAVQGLLEVDAAAMEWLGVVALFTEVRVEISDDASDVPLLAEFAGVSVPQVRRWNAKGLAAQVLSDRGDRIFVTPQLLAVLLAREVLRARRADLPRLLQNLPPRLQESFASQLLQLRYSAEGKALARELIAANGPFGDLLSHRESWARAAFLALGTIAKDDALARLEGWAEITASAAAELDHDRHLQQLVFRLIWREEHFEPTFRLVIRGLNSAAEPSTSGLYGLLSGSLRVILASSRAPFPERLLIAVRAVRDPLLRADIRRLVLRALAEGVGGTSGDGYGEDDVDIDGRNYWRPPTYGDWWACTRAVVELLVECLTDLELAIREEAASNLIDHAPEFVRHGGHEPLLASISQVLAIDPRVGTLREELERCIAADGLPAHVNDSIRAAISDLPRDLPARIRVLVETWPLFTERADRSLPDRPDVADVASEIMDSRERSGMIALLFEPWARNSGALLIALAEREDAVEAWPLILAAAQRVGQTWGASLFLAVAHTQHNDEFRHTAVELLASSNPYERELGAEAITKTEADDDAVSALADAIRAGSITPSTLRYAVMGRWAERRAAGIITDLVLALAARDDGGPMAIALLHAAGENLAISDADLIELLSSSMFDVQGHDLWTWEQVGKRAAKRSPLALGNALMEHVGARESNPEYAYRYWSGDEASRLLEHCIDAEPSLVYAVLDLWARAPRFVESFGAAALLRLDAATLADWAGDTARQESLARVVIAGPHPTTQALLERFGPRSTFGTRLREELRPRSWSGSLSSIVKSHADQARSWCADTENSSAFREWAGAAADWLDMVARDARRYD